MTDVILNKTPISVQVALHSLSSLESTQTYTRPPPCNSTGATCIFFFVSENIYMLNKSEKSLIKKHNIASDPNYRNAIGSF